MHTTEIRGEKNPYGQIYYDTSHLALEYCALHWYEGHPLQVTLDGEFTLVELQRLVAHMEQIEKVGRDASY